MLNATPSRTRDFVLGEKRELPLRGLAVDYAITMRQNRQVC